VDRQEQSRRQQQETRDRQDGSNDHQYGLPFHSFDFPPGPRRRENDNLVKEISSQGQYSKVPNASLQ
jgi:hypothetical protein